MKHLKTVVVVVICASLCLGYYYYLMHRDTGNQGKMTEVEMIITQDLEKSYPKTARGVLKFYNRILCCYYNETYTTTYKFIPKEGIKENFTRTTEITSVAFSFAGKTIYTYEEIQEMEEAKERLEDENLESDLGR